MKQLEHSKIVIPINEEIGLPLSSEVWASFLIGKNINLRFEYSSIFINIIFKIGDIFNINLYKGFIKNVKNFLYKLGFHSPYRFGGLNQKTFLDVTKSKEINVPFYNFDNKTFDIIYQFGKNKVSLKRTFEILESIYNNRKNQILNEIERIDNKDVIFAFIHTIDVLQHISYLHISKIKEYYIDLDNYVSILKRKLEDSMGDVIFIIISDHGFDFNIGNHSKYAFYSSNVNLIPKPKNIIDFHGIILDIVSKQLCVCT